LIDVGLNPLFATDRGDLFGRQFHGKLIEFDRNIVRRMMYGRKMREFLKNEIERLDLRSPDLTRRRNRLITNFGKRYINEKIERLRKLYCIDFIFVNPAFSSQENSECVRIKLKRLSKWMDVPCGYG